MNTITGNGVLTESAITYLHKKLANKHGKAIKCEMCKVEGRSKYEWALKKGKEYSANPDDYMQLCCSCHRKYDYTEQQKSKISKAHKGRKKGLASIRKFVFSGINATKKPVLQHNLDGYFIKEWETASEASRVLEISQSSIVMNLKGKYKKSGGYIWKYKN